MRSLQNENGRSDSQSSVNTPDSLRRSSNGSRHMPNTSTTSSPIQQRSDYGNANIKGSTYVPLPLKKEKMEFNERIMRGGEGRPLSYHGKSYSTSDSNGGMSTTPGTLPISPLILRKRAGGQGPSPVKVRTKDANLNRRSMPVGTVLENRLRDKFNLADLDTNLPRIDIEAIETHLRLAGEEDRKQRRSDRDEIRRRLALESDELVEKSGGRKPSLHSRLQSSMNLQICFMNETASDSESPGSDPETKSSQQPGSLPFINSNPKTSSDGNGEDFYVKQAKLQAEARQALSQVKDLVRLQISHEKEQRRYSPITEMVRNSLQKVGITLSPERRRLSRQLLTDMNVAQLQVIVNDLHNHIEDLNEKLVSMLLDRDELHMEQDSMLVDIEDLSRYLAAKETSPHQSLPLIPPPKSVLLGRK